MTGASIVFGYYFFIAEPIEAKPDKTKLTENYDCTFFDARIMLKQKEKFAFLSDYNVLKVYIKYLKKNNHAGAS
jgi:hypothetical protein